MTLAVKVALNPNTTKQLNRSAILPFDCYQVSVANSFDASEYEGGIEHSWSSECGTPSFMREDNSGSVECREYETDLGRTEKLRLNDHDIEDLSYDTKLKLFK